MNLSEIKSKMVDFGFKLERGGTREKFVYTKDNGRKSVHLVPDGGVRGRYKFICYLNDQVDVIERSKNGLGGVQQFAEKVVPGVGADEMLTMLEELDEQYKSGREQIAELVKKIKAQGLRED